MDALNLENSISSFIDGIASWGAVALPNLIAALMILIVGLTFASWAARRVKNKILTTNRIDNTFAGSISSLVQYAIVLVIVIAALGQLGFQTTSLLAALGAAGLAIGLALQSTLSNIAAGFMLLWLRPFRVGDFIKGGGVSGTVKEVNLFASQLETYDGIFEFVPNSELWNTRITNYSRLPNRMLDLRFGISYDDEVAQAQEVLLKLAQSDDRIQDHPAAPNVFVFSLDDSAVTLGMRVWVKTKDYWATRWSLTEKAKLELDQAGITIPYPHVTVDGMPEPAAPQQPAS